MARNENNRVTLERTGRTPVIDVAMHDILAETQVARLEASPVTLLDKKAIFIHSAEQNGRPMENADPGATGTPVREQLTQLT